MSSPRRVLPQQSQPRTFKPSLKSLLLLPFRICNPPPSVGKVRSCSVTPVFDVRLEDILERKHLPPLGLKDFEEWLLYVELSPENLYFILWLREYTVRYRRSKHLRDEARQYGLEWPTYSSRLAMFYARAKQTFFTPNSHYELNLPSDMLAPFHMTNSSPHPDPAVFDQVAIETQRMLKESLQRFVSAQFNNVGNNRVICGLIGGTVFCLVGALLPIIYNFTMGQSRWSRLSALPGLWLGLSVLFASLHGVCLGVYIFGDLRQLRRFELSRPPISKPQPYRPRPVISSPITSLPVSPTQITSIDNYTEDFGILPPPPAHTRFSFPSSHHSVPSVYSPSASSSDLSYSGSDGMIHISPAYYDPEPIEGPATSPGGIIALPAKQKSAFDDDDDDEENRPPFGATAAFIHPFDHFEDDDYDLNNPKRPLVQERQRVSSFDFDALPPPPAARVQPRSPPPPPQPRRPPYPIHSDSPKSTSSLQLTPSIMVIQPEQETPDKELTPKGFIRRIQSRCNINKWLVMTSSNSTTDLNEKVPDDLEKAEYERSNFPRPHPSLQRDQKTSNLKRQFKMVKAVPAFASPLTRVLSPVVIRGQWEIVMRSMIIACFVSWFTIGILLAVPVPKTH
ncbi:uncharacterized protein C8R40DRAFT_1172773 [Lentinula edodes]|uniref:uncharacterized protein n=1 Tax=Lentinula edodes TaxID=5353 RepID=UPI001E8D6F13|nr:uncharacterized protein C8R40DRAFT_1172773 [Lentinula edodes]KAH7873130.1 hypothetical protein C8R40DRAFT_1172773 [Lentinula edodes]KAJ3921341.1 hypothetical protein F5877DRAFT_76303 [Lentinula edodes]